MRPGDPLGLSAPMLLVEPRITLRVNGAVAVSPPSVSLAPAGRLASVGAAVWGSSRRVAVADSPRASRAVSSISRYDGNSWSGAGNEPLATPPKLCSVCVWQDPLARSQWRRWISHVRPPAGIGAPAARSPSR